MKHFHITAIAFCILMAAHVSPRQERKFGLGLILGQPTGVSAKYWMSSTTAFDFALGSGIFGDDDGFHFHVDYLWHSFDVIKSTERFPIYYGVGGSVNSDGENSLARARRHRRSRGCRTILPSTYFSNSPRRSGSAPSTDFVVEGGAGVRYFF